MEPMPLDTLVELVNGWGIEPRRAGARTDVPPIGDHIHQTGLPASVTDALTDLRLIRFANTIFDIFASEGTAGRVAAVSAWLARIDVRPDLVLVSPVGREDSAPVDIEAGRPGVAAGPSVRRTWRVNPRDALLAAALLALRDQLCDEDPDRLGICVDGGCADIYIDVSPAGRRRFCSVTCQNRARAAKYRRNHRTNRNQRTTT